MRPWTKEQYMEYIQPETRTPEGRASWERRWGITSLSKPEWKYPLGYAERDAKI